MELDGIGKTQIDTIKDYFSRDNNIKITKNLINQLSISNYNNSRKDGKFSNKRIMFTGDFKV